MEKLRELNAQGFFFLAIPVYDADWKTVIGEFEIDIDAGLFFTGSISEEEMTRACSH